MGHESERSQTVGYAAIDDAVVDKTVLSAAVRAGEEAAAMDVDKDGQPFGRVFGRRRHAQIEAVFAHRQRIAALIGVIGLHRTVSPVFGIVDALPRGFLYRRVPAQFADWLLGIRNGFVESIAVVELALDFALLARCAENLGVDGDSRDSYRRQ